MFNVKKILVPVDLHQDANAIPLVKAAADLARKYDAHLTFLNVVDVDLDSAMIDRFDDIRSAYAKAAWDQLKRLIEMHLPDGLNAEVLVLNGRSYSKVVDAAEDLEADLIVVTAHKPGMKDFLLGVTAARVVRHASCSVLVIREDGA